MASIEQHSMRKVCEIQQIFNGIDDGRSNPHVEEKYNDHQQQEQPEDNQQQNDLIDDGINKNDNMPVAMRRRMFEMNAGNNIQESFADINKLQRSQQQLSRPSLLKPQRMAPPPPNPKQNTNNNNSIDSSLSTMPIKSNQLDKSNDFEQPKKLQNEQQEVVANTGTGIVKELAERLKIQFELRSLRPAQSAQSSYVPEIMKMSQLKELDEKTVDTCLESILPNSKINEAKEVKTQSEVEDDDSEMDLDEYSDMSDATTTTDMGEMMNQRRQSSFGKQLNKTLHNDFLAELRNKAMFKRCGIQSVLPSELGRLRTTPRKPLRKGCTSEPSAANASIQRSNAESELVKSHTEPTQIAEGSSQCNLLRAQTSNWPSSSKLLRRGIAKANTASFASSSRSDSMFLEEDGHEQEMGITIPHYDTGDIKEDKRLRELHLIMFELVQMQQNYVDLLRHIGENYPKYIRQCESQRNRSWLVPFDAVTPHPIERISNHFKQILGVHEIFLNEFITKLAKWDSHKPDLAEVFNSMGEFLKICNNFLKQKRTLVAHFQQALEENRELADVTRKFEQGNLSEQSGNGNENASVNSEGIGNVMNMSGISILMQLDAVHQNVVRYKLLMERYRKYLPNNSLEASIADEALKKLTAVSNTVNEFLADADADEKLMELHRKLQGIFDVFAIGRKLLHQGELQRQTRNKLQLRYLILFSDMLLICRYTGALGVVGADSFDASKLYQIPIEKIRVEVDDHEDYEREFVVRSSKKSSAFVVQSKSQRDLWVRRIKEAKDLRRAKKKISLSHGEKCESSLERSERVENADNTVDVGKLTFGSKDALPTSSQFSMLNEDIPSCNESPDVEQKQFMCGTKTAAPSSFNASDTNHALLQSRHYDALWIPDYKATKCMMAGCGTKFNVYRRRHHCRQCGFLICRNCVGLSPVWVKKWAKHKVCPECFYENKKKFEQGMFFPPDMIHFIHPPKNEVSTDDKSQQKFSLDDPNLRIIYDEKLFPPSELFIPPTNGPKSRIPVKTRELEEQPLAKGKVYFRNQKGVTALRWAKLTKNFFLQFYEAEFDEQPCDSFFIYGYTVNANETEESGTVIVLSHRNQFQTDRKEDQIVFHVINSKLAEKWLDALREKLAIEKPLEEESEEESIDVERTADQPQGLFCEKGNLEG